MQIKNSRVPAPPSDCLCMRVCCVRSGVSWLIPTGCRDAGHCVQTRSTRSMLSVTNVIPVPSCRQVCRHGAAGPALLCPLLSLNTYSLNPEAGCPSSYPAIGVLGVAAGAGPAAQRAPPFSHRGGWATTEVPCVSHQQHSEGCAVVSRFTRRMRLFCNTATVS